MAEYNNQIMARMSGIANQISLHSCPREKERKESPANNTGLMVQTRVTDDLEIGGIPIGKASATYLQCAGEGNECFSCRLLSPGVVFVTYDGQIKMIELDDLDSYVT